MTGKVDSGWAMARAVSTRLEEGNFKGAVSLLTSEDSLSVPTSGTLTALLDKHPAAPQDRRPLLQPDSFKNGLSFDEATVRKAVYSFPPGSSGGSDGLSPQHLKDMIACEGVPSGLLAALTSIC